LVVVAARAVAPGRLRARLARRSGLAIRALARQAAVRRRRCVVRAGDAARAEGNAWDGDARPLRPAWVGALRHKRACEKRPADDAGSVKFVFLFFLTTSHKKMVSGNGVGPGPHR